MWGGVFYDTGLEYPEIRQFVRGFDGITWLKPKMTFKEVITKYGYPFISKNVSQHVYYGQYHLKKNGIDNTREDAEELLLKAAGDKYKIRELFGINTRPDGELSQFQYKKYSFMVRAPFKIGEGCCHIMKKGPAKEYQKITGKFPITAQMASESKQRAMTWLKNGCNGFDLKSPMSNPMSFWTNQDVLLYIYENKIPICSIYGEVIPEGEIKGQAMGAGLFDLEKPTFKTTGCNRTGCMFCGYGCHLEKKGQGRFEMMKKTHPKQYAYIMKPVGEGGLGYKECIDWLNENGGLNIRY